MDWATLNQINRATLNSNRIYTLGSTMTKLHVHRGGLVWGWDPYWSTEALPYTEFYPAEKLLPGAQCLQSNNEGLKK